MINNDFDTPIMYQDLANYSMGPMITPFGGITNPYNTSFLRGTTMQRQLDADKVEIMKQKENQDKSTFKKAALGLGLIIAAGFIPAIRKGIKNGNLWQSVKNAFNEPVMPKTKNWFKKSWQGTKNFLADTKVKCQDNMPKVKNWFEQRLQGAKNFFEDTKVKCQTNMPKAKKWLSGKWDSFKNLFKRNNDKPQREPIMPKVKTWFSGKWDSFKKMFKK